MQLIEIIAAILFFGFVFILGIWGRGREKRQWNNGICARSGESWRFFDMASDGSRGYKDGKGNYCWVSYNIDK